MPAVACSHTTASNFCHADTLTPRGSFGKLSVVLFKVNENRAGPSQFTADRCQKSSAATSQG